jgi:succinyl-CoA synthetase alpha subunit
MSILVNADTKLVVQGITGGEGTFHTLWSGDRSEIREDGPTAGVNQAPPAGS